MINREADRRLLAAFINGLSGLPGKQVRMQMPDNVDKALKMVIVATNAEKEEKTLVKEDRVISARVFTVGGNRGGTQYNPRGNRNERPGEISSGAKDEVPDPVTGQDRHETRVEFTGPTLAGLIV